MLVVGSGVSGGAVRRVYRADRFALLGTAFGYSTVKAALLVEKRFDMLEGRAKGGNRFDLRMRVEKILGAETARGRSTVVSTIKPHVFDGVMRGRATVSAFMEIRHNLLGWASGQAATGATLRTVKNFVGQAQGVTAWDARLTVEKILGAQPVVGSAQVASTLLVEKVLTSAMIGNSAAAATVLIEKRLQAATSGLTTAAAALLTEKVLGSATQGSTAVSGALRTEKVLRPDPITGTSSMSGQEIIWKALQASTSGIAIVRAELEPLVTYRRTQGEDIRVNETTDVRQTERDVN